MNLSLLSFKVCSLLAQVQADERLMPFTDDRKYYVPWNPGYFEQGRQLLWNLIGTAFNIGMAMENQISILTPTEIKNQMQTSILMEMESRIQI